MSHLFRKLSLIAFAIKLGKLAVACPLSATAILSCGAATWTGIADLLDSMDGNSMTRKDWADVGGKYAVCVGFWLGALAEASQ